VDLDWDWRSCAASQNYMAGHATSSAQGQDKAVVSRFASRALRRRESVAARAVEMRRIRVVVGRAQAGTSQKWLNNPIKIINGMGTPRTKSKIERIRNLLD
jgi:hypothetical protein